MIRFILVLSLSSFLFACNSNTSSETQEETAETSTPAENPAPTEAAPVGEPTLPSVPLETLQELWDKCDYIDYVFYYTNFSMSQDKQASIRTTLRQISDEPAVLNPNCKAIGNSNDSRATPTDKHVVTVPELARLHHSNLFSLHY